MSSVERRGVFYLIGKTAQERGAGTENVVKGDLDYLVEKGKVDGYERSKNLDRKGIDFLVARGTKKYKLSVKSSQTGVEQEREKHPERFRHDDIIFVVPDITRGIPGRAQELLGEFDAHDEKFKHGKPS